jgi:hydrogenase expression/formation protein HypE
MQPETGTILLAHGGGGLLARELIQAEIVGRFGDGPLRGLPDAARLPASDGALLFTTDSFVVSPLVFPGGDIGTLAVCGTVNDLAVAGARPRWLSLGLVLEEGLERALLGRILDSVRNQAEACGVRVVTGDTKVVPHGLCDGMYINTAGIGNALQGLEPDAARVREGDSVLLSGTLGDHGMAVLACREGIAVEGPRSDCGPVHRLTAALAPLGPAVRFLRDPTRGGVAGVLHDLADARPVGIDLDEAALPVAPATQAVAELLGIDLLGAACEGRVLAVLAPDAADAALRAWTALPEGAGAVRIGRVTGEAGRVALRTVAGGRRRIDAPRGEQLPRIC